MCKGLFITQHIPDLEYLSPGQVQQHWMHLLRCSWAAGASSTVFRGWLGKNKNRQAGEGAEDMESSSFFCALCVCISLKSFYDHLLLPHRLDWACRLLCQKPWLAACHTVSLASNRGSCVIFLLSCYCTSAVFSCLLLVLPETATHSTSF